MLLTPASLSYHQWILCSPLISPPLILMYKIRCNNCPSPEHFLNPLGFCSQRLSSAWLRKPLIRLFLRLGVLLSTPPQHFLKQGTLHPRIFICMGPRTYAVALADNSHSSLPRVTTLSGGQNLPKMLPHPCCAPCLLGFLKKLLRQWEVGLLTRHLTDCGTIPNALSSLQAGSVETEG